MPRKKPTTVPDAATATAAATVQNIAVPLKV
jgi:hypothetical protein